MLRKNKWNTEAQQSIGVWRFLFILYLFGLVLDVVHAPMSCRITADDPYVSSSTWTIIKAFN